jgi:multidrug resistance efflux pump
MMRVVLLVSFSLLALMLVGCGAVGGSPTPLPTVVLDSGGGARADVTPEAVLVTASGTVVSDQEANLASVLGGLVRAVHVTTGDAVREGDILIELDDAAAQAELAAAERSLRELTSPAAIAAAEQGVANSQKARDDAEKKVVGLDYPRASDSLIKNLKGQIELARILVKDTTDAYNRVKDRASDDPRRASALVAKTEAEMALNRLVANYNWYTGKPTDIDTALAQANFHAAQAAYDEAQWYLAALRGESLPSNASGMMLAELQAAQDRLAVAEWNVQHSRLASPFSGNIVRVDAAPGEYVAPGQFLLTLINTSQLHVETSDLSERDVPNVAVGQPATIMVKPLDIEIPGHVVAISPQADMLGGDVVYRAIVALDELPEALRAGMSVDVGFQAGR